MEQPTEKDDSHQAAVDGPANAPLQGDKTFVSYDALDFTQLGLKRVLSFGFCIWAFMTAFLWRRYRLTFEMSDAEQPLTLFSENALYYSFYLDVVRAPSWLQALQSLLYDRRSEHPDTINALERFNIYPELLLGLVYRSLRFVLGHKIEMLVRTPFNFYAANIICFQGLGVGCVCVLASLVGNSFLCGISCFGFFWGNFYHRLILRTDALALREHWGLPFLWMNVIAIFVMLQRHVRLRDQGKIYGPLLATVVTAIGLMLTWQFGVFILTTQVAALFGMCLLGYPMSIVIRRIVAFYVFSLLIAFAFMFAPKYLAFSFFPHVAVSVFLSLWWCPRHTAKPKSFPGWLLIVDFRRGLVSLAICALIRCALLPFDKDDAHVYRLLMYHLGLARNTFDSNIYILGQTEFLPLSSTLANHMRSSGVLFVAGLMAAAVLLFISSEVVFVHRFSTKCWEMFLRYDDGLAPTLSSKGRRMDKADLCGQSHTVRAKARPVSTKTPISAHSDAQKTSEESYISALSPGLCYLFLQALCFTALMLLIARLRVLALPLLCVLASLVASASFWRACIGRAVTAPRLISALRHSVGKRTQRVLKIAAFLVLAILSLMPFYIKLPLNEMLISVPALENANNQSRQRLLEWLSNNVPPGSGIMADMTTSAVIRAALPSLRIVVHPQYENVGIRRRVQFSYGVAACPPMAMYNRLLRDVYKADYLVQNSFRCSVPPNSTTSVFDVADKIDEFQFQCTPGISQEQRFCFRTLFDNNRFFNLVYANEIFSVLKRVESSGVLQQAAFSPSGTPGEYESFNWKEEILKRSSWQPWIDRCRRNDPHCGANIAGIGMRMLERHQLTQVATFLHTVAAEEFSDADTMEQYALYLDFNLRNPSAAEKYYRMAVSVHPPSLTRAVQFALFLQENGKGTEEFLNAAKEVITATKALSSNTGELLKEEDNICRGAVLLQLLANDMSHNMTGDIRKQLNEAAHGLWLKASEINIQNGCVVQHWQLFEGKSLPTARRIFHFFMGKL
ncbi:hypothetical protein Efla_006940 [Eimeria flavescens]